jgi:hypothetical protein
MRCGPDTRSKYAQHEQKRSGHPMWRQPKSVWAVAIASVVAFMGRYTGAAVAPWVAGVLGERINMHAPFWVGAAAVLLGAGVLAATRSHLGGIDAEDKDVQQTAEEEAVAITLGTDS